MSGINLMIGITALLGFLPLAIIIQRRRSVDRLLKFGLSATGTVSHIVVLMKPRTDLVHFSFIAADGKQYSGKLTTGPGTYKMHDQLEVFYDQHKPSRNTVKGAWKSLVILIFGILLGIGVAVMMWQLYFDENYR